MAHEPALNLPNPWAAVGRDTEAGRALFALYNGFGHARSRGNDYSQMNRMKHLKHMAMHGVPEFPVPKPLPPKRPEVKVPHFPHKSYCSDDYHPVDFIPRRRRGAEILQQIRDDSYVVDPPPMPKGPLLDEAEKARLQEVFYWSNRNLGPEPPVAEPVRRLPKKGSIEEQELLLNEIAKEVEDREAFLNKMEEYGTGEEYRGHIIFEIQQRVGQMKLLHQNITEQEKRENEKKSEITSPQDELYIAPPPKSHARSQGRKANVTTLTFDPQFDQDPRFERSSNSTRQATQYPSFTTSRADETPKFTSSPHDATFSTDPFMKSRTDTPEPSASAPNVIRTTSCCGNAPPAPPMPDSQKQPTKPPPTKLPAPTEKILNLNLALSSPPNSVGGCSPALCPSPAGSAAARPPSSLRSDPRSRVPARCPPSCGKSSDRDTSRVPSTSNANYPSGSIPWTDLPSPGSPARSPSSIASDPRSRAHGVRFQPSGTPSGPSMSRMSSNSNAASPSGATPSDECPTSSTTAWLRAPPPDFEGSRTNERFEHSPETSERFLSGVTSNSNANFPPQPTCWDNPCSPARSPSSIFSDPRSRAQCGRFQPRGDGISEYMSGVPSNSIDATYPSRSTPCDGGCSPMDSPHHCNFVNRDD